MSAAGDTALNARLLQRDASVERWSLLGLASPAILKSMLAVTPLGEAGNVLRPTVVAQHAAQPQPRQRVDKLR